MVIKWMLLGAYCSGLKHLCVLYRFCSIFFCGKKKLTNMLCIFINQNIMVNSFCLYKLTGKEKLNGDSIVLEEDGSVVDEDDVVKALDKNTVLMVLKEDESWAPISKASVSQNMEEKKGRRNTERTSTTDGCMRLDNFGGTLKLRKPTEEV